MERCNQPPPDDFPRLWGVEDKLGLYIPKQKGVLALEGELDISPRRYLSGELKSLYRLRTGRHTPCSSAAKLHWQLLLPDSTNTVAKRLAAQGAPAGTTIVADHQTGGRGRLGRRFQSPAGLGTYLSIILRPNAKPEQLMTLTAMIAEAVCEAVEQACQLRPQIKWANDLLFQKRKICGILTELSVEAESGLVQYAVVGIGMNCNQRPEDFPPELQKTAISLSMALGHTVNRNLVAAGRAPCGKRPAGRRLPQVPPPGRAGEPPEPCHGPRGGALQKVLPQGRGVHLHL